MVKQISVFLENKSGRLSDILTVIGENNINIHALSIADTTDFGILRLIMDKPEDAKRILNENGFSAKTTECIAISVEDTPGGLSRALSELRKNNIDIEYLYAFNSKSNKDGALVIMRVKDIDEAVKVLKADGIYVLESEEVYNL